MNKRHGLRIKRHRGMLLKMQGTSVCPRLIVHRSHKNISAQVIDDTKHATLISLSSQNKQLKQNAGSYANLKGAELFGEAFGRLVKEKGITKVVFDRAGFLYHGRIKAFAGALRKAGLEF